MKKNTSILVVAGLGLGALVLFIGQSWSWLGLQSVLPVQVLLLSLIWSALGGLTYAAAPEAGGLFIGFGHLTLFTGAIAVAMPVVEPLALVDAIRLSNAALGFLAAAAILARDMARGGVILSMAACAAVGAALGSAASSLGTLGAIGPRTLHLMFGLYLAALTAAMGRRHTKAGQAQMERDRKAGAALEEVGGGVQTLSRSLRKVIFVYGGVEFAFRPLSMMGLGLAVGLATPLLGVGGFIFLPLFARITQLPTRLARPAAAKAVAVACAVQAAVFLTAPNASVATPLLGAEAVGLLSACLAGLFYRKIANSLTPHRIFLAPAAYFCLRSLLLALFGIRLWP